MCLESVDVCTYTGVSVTVRRGRGEGVYVSGTKDSKGRGIRRARNDADLAAKFGKRNFCALKSFGTTIDSAVSTTFQVDLHPSVTRPLIRLHVTRNSNARSTGFLLPRSPGATKIVLSKYDRLAQHPDESSFFGQLGGEFRFAISDENLCEKEFP